MIGYTQDSFGLTRVPPAKFDIRPPLKLLWSYEGALVTPLVHGDRLFTTVRRNPLEEAHVACLETSGNEVWISRTTVEAGWALDSDRLVAVTKQSGGHFIVLETETGRVIRELPTEYWLKALLPDGYFLGRSRLERDDGSPGSSLALIRLGDLASVWQKVSEGQYTTRDGPRRDIQFDQDLAVLSDRIFIGRGDTLVCLERSNGREIWSSPVDKLGGPMDPGKWKPMVAQGLVVVSVIGGTAAFDVETGELSWLFDKNRGSRMVYGGRVYLVNSETNSLGSYHVVDLVTGELLQERSTAAMAADNPEFESVFFTSSPLVAESHVFIGDGIGRLWALDRDSGTPVWFHRTREGQAFLGSVPVPAGNRIYITSFSMDPRHPSRLYCYEQV